MWRWADPDACGSGISGPANSSAIGIPANYFDAAGNYVGKSSIRTPIRLAAPWSLGSAFGSTNNVGMNDEPFSFHSGGCNCVMVDGSVHFLSDTLEPVTLRYMVTRSENKSINVDF